MNKYKVSITKTYCIDVLATSEEQVIQLAEPILDQKMLDGTEHYNQTGDTDFMVYEVTNTEDLFYPENTSHCPVCYIPFIGHICPDCDKLVKSL